MAEAVGLDRKTARLAATHALVDGIAALHESNLTLKELITGGGYARRHSGHGDGVTGPSWLSKDCRAGFACRSRTSTEERRTMIKGWFLEHLGTAAVAESKTSDEFPSQQAAERPSTGPLRR